MVARDRETPRFDFSFLEAHDDQLVRLGMLAERYSPDDPNTSLLKIRQVGELLAQLVASKVGVFTSREEPQYELLQRLQDQGILPQDPTNEPASVMLERIRAQGAAAAGDMTSRPRSQATPHPRSARPKRSVSKKRRAS